MNKSITFALILFFSYNAFSQERPSYPKIGYPCPDFHFTDVAYYPRKNISLKDFKGKWLMLDLWNRHCSICLARMPLTDSLQKKFFRQVNFMLVGYTGSLYSHRSDEKPIHELYARIRTRLKVDLPVAFDSVLFHRFDIGPCPYIVVVDPNGIVRGITTKLDEQDIRDFLSGSTPLLDKAVNRKGI